VRLRHADSTHAFEILWGLHIRVQHMLLNCEALTYRYITFQRPRLYVKSMGPMSKAQAQFQKPGPRVQGALHLHYNCKNKDLWWNFFLFFHIPLCKNLAQVFRFHAPRFIIIINIIWHNWKNPLQKRPTQSKPRRTSNPETQNLSN
jgi:hypothetical protein